MAKKKVVLPIETGPFAECNQSKPNPGESKTPMEQIRFEIKGAQARVKHLKGIEKMLEENPSLVEILATGKLNYWF